MHLYRGKMPLPLNIVSSGHCQQWDPAKREINEAESLFLRSLKFCDQ
jgi:hypothetical protein